MLMLPPGMIDDLRIHQSAADAISPATHHLRRWRAAPEKRLSKACKRDDIALRSTISSENKVCMHNFTIQARVLILGMIAVGSMVIASGVGIFELSRFNTQLRANLVDIRQGIGTLIDIQTAAVAFKTQVQEWKN
ncbi:MAG TPA: hypothetical protein PKA47_14605, partial [Accumulibacter sp.]|nr:hypothetical protein [Accumulibacter sp.]